jgi:hypothetical protein
LTGPTGFAVAVLRGQPGIIANLSRRAVMPEPTNNRGDRYMWILLTVFAVALSQQPKIRRTMQKEIADYKANAEMRPSKRRPPRKPPGNSPRPSAPRPDPADRWDPKSEVAPLCLPVRREIPAQESQRNPTRRDEFLFLLTGSTGPSPSLGDNDPCQTGKIYAYGSNIAIWS